jgi:cytochrome c5
MRIFLTTMFTVALALVSTGCAGTASKETPVEVFGDMAHQPKYKPQAVGKHFSYDMSTAGPVAGTVAMGGYQPNDIFNTGVENGNYVGVMPMTPTRESLKVGQAKFNTYCSPCHSRVGDGRGIVGQKSGWIASSLIDKRATEMADGYLYHVIANGVRSMPAYRNQIPVADRWAIVGYLRVLQRAANGTMEDVPADMKGRLE